MLIDNMKKMNGIKMLKYTNKPLLILSIVFAVAGALCILSASSISSSLRYGYDTPYMFFLRQLLFIVVGLIATGIIICSIPTKRYGFLSSVALIVMIIWIIATVFVDKVLDLGVNAVAIDLGFFTFQPAEVLKILMIVFLGNVYSKIATTTNEKVRKWWIGISIFVALTCSGMILLAGDFGSALIMAALFALMLLCTPSKVKYLKIFKIIIAICAISGVLFLKFGYLILPDEWLENSYRWGRFNYTQPCDRYEDNSGYQVCNGFIAMDNGGLTGLGPGGSIQKYLYLPESHTDFIFPIIIEEFGLISGAIIFIFYIVIIILILKVAIKCYELENQIICYGIATYIMLHIFVNLGGALGIIPLTGVPLPFLSYGGSFCICLFASLAIVQRINSENEYTRRLKEFKNKKAQNNRQK